MVYRTIVKLLPLYDSVLLKNKRRKKLQHSKILSKWSAISKSVTRWVLEASSNWYYHNANLTTVISNSIIESRRCNTKCFTRPSKGAQKSRTYSRPNTIDEQKRTAIIETLRVYYTITKGEAI